MEVTQIKAVFACGKRSAITHALYMYDVGVELGIFGVDLPEYFIAYFANAEGGTAIKMLGHDGYVEIPNILLTTGLPVYCWIYVTESEAEARTMYMARIPVRQRARDDSEVAPAQKEAIEAAIAALNTSEENATQSALMAAGYAKDAEAWAIGQRGGEDVGEDDETYENNSKYYAQQSKMAFDDLGLSVIEGMIHITFTPEEDEDEHCNKACCAG